MSLEIFLVCIIAVLATALVMCGIFSYKGKGGAGGKSFVLSEENVCVTTQMERKQLEFMKKIMIVLLTMWVLGCVCSLWMVVIHRSIEALELAQSFISFPLTAGVISYSCKSGFENCSKNKLTQFKVEKEAFVEEGEVYGPHDE